MAQKTVVTVVCDLPHDGEIEGNETVSFAFDGASYEIDVCSAHAKELQDNFGPYAEHGRRIIGAGSRRRGRARCHDGKLTAVVGPRNRDGRRFAGGDVAPYLPGSRFRVFDN